MPGVTAAPFERSAFLGLASDKAAAAASQATFWLRLATASTAAADTAPKELPVLDPEVLYWSDVSTTLQKFLPS